MLFMENTKLNKKAKKRTKNKLPKVKDEILISSHQPEKKYLSPLFFSSFCFITNVISTFEKKYYLYSFFFSMLTITSLIHHSNYTELTSIIDRCSIMLVVLYGGYTLYNNKNNAIVKGITVVCFLLPEYCVSNNYHILLHLIGSIGHHLIIFTPVLN